MWHTRSHALGQYDKLPFNTGMMVNPGVDRFNVWPNALDRPQLG
jgi:hypothetical protein